MKQKLKKLGKRFGRFFFTFSLCSVFVFYSTISVCYADSWIDNAGEYISDNPDSLPAEALDWVIQNGDGVGQAALDIAKTAASAISNEPIREGLLWGIAALENYDTNGGEFVEAETEVNPDLKPDEGGTVWSNGRWNIWLWSGETGESSSGSYSVGDVNSDDYFYAYWTPTHMTIQLKGAPANGPSKVFWSGDGGLGAGIKYDITPESAEYDYSLGISWYPSGSAYHGAGIGSSISGGNIRFTRIPYGTTSISIGYFSVVKTNPMTFVNSFRSAFPNGRPQKSDFTPAEIENGDYARAVMVYDYIDSCLTYALDMTAMPEHDIVPYIDSNILGFIPNFWTEIQRGFLDANPSPSYARKAVLKASSVGYARSLVIDFDGLTVPLHGDLSFSMPAFHLWLSGFGTDTLYWTANSDAGFVSIPSGLSYLWDFLAYFVAVMWTYALMKALLKEIVHSSDEGGDN